MIAARARRLIAVVVLVTACRPAAGETPPEAPRVMGPSSRLLALDTRVFAQLENARLVLGVPEKHPGNPLLRSDEPWENSTNNYYPNVAWDADSRLWKLWYKDVLADKDAIARMDGPATIHDVGWYLLHATSPDGVRWTKPRIGLHAFAGDTANNIVARDCPNVGVFLDPHDPDPGRRYKMVFDRGLGKIFARFSADGVRWGEPVAMQGFGDRNGDTHNNAFFDRRTGRYLWFTKLYLGERLVARLESDDFLHWRNSGVVLRSGVEEARRSQTYALTVFPYGSVYLGYLMMYRVGGDRTVDVELAWSPDSVTWRRVRPGTPFLPLGPPGSIDSGTIYAPAGPALLRDGRLQILYGGSPAVHAGWKRSAHLCLATLREDGFAAYEQADPARPAVLTTALLVPDGSPPRATADGDVRMETLPEADGRVRLRFTIEKGGRLWSIDGFSLVDTALPPDPGPPLPRLPVKRDAVTVSFDDDAEGWKGIDAAVARDGHLHVTRGTPQQPFARGTPLAGDWPEILGGDAVVLTARVRTGEPEAALRVEIGTTGDVPGWYVDLPAAVGPEWATAAVTLRYDWTDDAARAAGWQRHQQGFSWRETIRHAGQIVLGAGRGRDGRQPEWLDVDFVRLEPIVDQQHLQSGVGPPPVAPAPSSPR